MIPMQDPLFWLLAIVGVIMTGISKSGFAGGAGVVAVPLLALVMPIPLAAALMLPLLLVMDAKTVALYKDSLSDLKSMIPMCIAALIGIAVAGTAMASLSTDVLQIALAILCIAFASWDNLAPLLARMPGAAFVWGGLSGITSTLLHAGGPPVSIYFLSKKLEKKQWLAQASVFFALMNVTKIIPYTLHDSWTKDVLIAGLILFPFALIGVKLGSKLQQHISQKNFVKICRGLLAVSGIILVIKLL
jgi:uncharacterized membrane protein YfcA